MIISGQAIDVFKLQKELIEVNVDMVVSRTIDRVVDQISALRNDMTSLKSDMNTQIHELRDEMNSQIHELKDEMNSQILGVREDMHGIRHEMRDGFSSLNTRVTAVETKLGIVNESHKEVRSRFIDYCFKAGWLILGVIISSLGAFVLHLT